VDSDRPGRAGAGEAVVGTVIELLPSALYRVRLDAGPAITAHVTGPVDRNFIRVLIGDRVRVALSAGDPTRGRILGRI